MRDPSRLRNLGPNRDSSKGQVPTATFSNLQTSIVSADCRTMPEIAEWHLLSSDLHNSSPSRLTMKLRPRCSSKGWKWTPLPSHNELVPNTHFRHHLHQTSPGKSGWFNKRKWGTPQSVCKPVQSQPALLFVTERERPSF